jgi:hypothetical protein
VKKLVDRWLGARRNNEEKGKFLRGRMGVLTMPFIGSSREESGWQAFDRRGEF